MKFTNRIAAAFTAASISVAPAMAAEEACVKGPDEVALQVRVIQTDLMVAALSCGASARYNEFVKANQPVLMAAHTQLTKFFTKKRGGQREYQMPLAHGVRSGLQMRALVSSAQIAKRPSAIALRISCISS